MKFKLSFCFLAIIFIFAFQKNSYSQTTYYISSSGNDSFNGTSENTPWKTISKINFQIFSPGDNIFFKKVMNSVMHHWSFHLVELVIILF